MTDQPAARYRKKPVEIDAIHFDGTPQSILAVMHFVDAGRATRELRIQAETDPSKSWIGIPTLEGTMRADAGDWIVRGVQGEFYPVKDAIFRETYERVDMAPQDGPVASSAPRHTPGGVSDPGPRHEPSDGRTRCVNCGQEVENKATPHMGGPGRDNWVHVPGSYEPCHPQRGADSPRAEPNNPA